MDLCFIDLTWETDRSYWTSNKTLPLGAFFATNPKTKTQIRNNNGERLCCLPNVLKVCFATPLNEYVYIDITGLVKKYFKTRKNITLSVRNAIKNELYNSAGEIFIGNPITYEKASIMSLNEARLKKYKVCGISEVVKKALETIE